MVGRSTPKSRNNTPQVKGRITGLARPSRSMIGKSSFLVALLAGSLKGLIQPLQLRQVIGGVEIHEGVFPVNQAGQLIRAVETLPL